MKITIESTPKVVTLVIDGANVPARVWQGETEAGIPVQCFITRIAPEVAPSDPNFSEITASFGAELQQTATPRPSVEAIPMRMIV